MWNPPREVEVLPELAAVERLTARVFDLRDDMGISPIPEFEVPPRYIHIFLEALSPSKRNDSKYNEHVYFPLGELAFTTAAGNQIVVRYLFSGQRPILYSIDGEHYQRSGPYGPREVISDIDESTSLTQVIREIYEETKGIPPRGLSHFLSNLQFSRGERRPGERAK
jgi:hypothetical protein